MSEILAFAGEHPVVAILTVWAVCGVVKVVIKMPFWALNRLLRSRNIAKHGWPAAPVDADGDVVYPGAK